MRCDATWPCRWTDGRKWQVADPPFPYSSLCSQVIFMALTGAQVVQETFFSYMKNAKSPRLKRVSKRLLSSEIHFPYFIWETCKWCQFSWSIFSELPLLLSPSLNLPLFCFWRVPTAGVPVRLSFDQPQLPLLWAIIPIRFLCFFSHHHHHPLHPVIWVILPSLLAYPWMDGCMHTHSLLNILLVFFFPPPLPNFSLLWLSLVSFLSSGMLHAHVSVNCLDLNSDSLSFTA